MDSSENININVVIADRPYRLKIKPHEEENIRSAAKLVNDTVKNFQSSYDAKDKQDFLAMAALFFTVEKLNLQHERGKSDEIIEKGLVELDNKLSQIIE